MPLRIRLPEALEERGITAYQVAKDSGGRISERRLYRIQQQRGRVQLLDMELLEALSDVLGVEPGELLEREGGRKARAGR